MRFKDIGIIISKKPYKENFSLISIFAKEKGLYTALVGKSKGKGPGAALEGNLVDFTWHAKSEEAVGFAKCEILKSFFPSIIGDKLKLYAFNSLVSLVKSVFRERESDKVFFDYLLNYIEKLSKKFDFAEYIECELAMLESAGYGLDLKECVVTGKKDNLIFVSPKSGRAVSLEAGARYTDKLLRLPRFLKDPSREPAEEEKREALDLTGYFFKRYCQMEKETHINRSNFINCVYNAEGLRA